MGLVQLDAVVDVERVVDTDAHRKDHHRQGGDGQADLQLLHEPVTDEGTERQRQTAHQHRPQVAIYDEHQQGDRGVDIEQHWRFTLLDLLVDRRNHPGIA
ncbi:hypothetical protein D3C76_1245540 [compost metagenome]